MNIDEISDSASLSNHIFNEHDPYSANFFASDLNEGNIMNPHNVIHNQNHMPDAKDISPNIEPNIIPFVPLYDEKIPNNFWGISKCYKVLSLVLTLNQLDSIEATGYFKNQKEDCKSI